MVASGVQTRIGVKGQELQPRGAVRGAVTDKDVNTKLSNLRCCGSRCQAMPSEDREDILRTIVNCRVR